MAETFIRKAPCPPYMYSYIHHKPLYIYLPQMCHRLLQLLSGPTSDADIVVQQAVGAQHALVAGASTAPLGRRTGPDEERRLEPTTNRQRQKATAAATQA